MPVKSLETYIFERGLAPTYPIEILKNARLGIDVNHYLSRLLSFGKEPYLEAIGGFPNSLKQYIESDLQVFKELNITPIFVFSGNATLDQFNFRNSKEITPLQRVRNQAWAKYQALLAQQAPGSLPLAAIDTFREFNTPLSVDSIFTELADLFHEHDLEFIRAPYLSWVQLGYLYENDQINAIYGPTETLLLQNVDKFILGMEFQTKEFRHIEKIKVLNEFGVNPQQFLDIAVSVGCDLQPTTLPIYSGYGATSLFEIGLALSNNPGTIYGTVYSLNDPEILAKFQRGVLAIQFMPVLKLNGRVEIHNFDEANAANLSPEAQPPTDIHDIIGQRLPHEYYFYESIGLIQPKILESIVFGKYVENQPLDGGVSTQYRNLVKATIDHFKNKEINILTQNMARYYQVKKIQFVRYFDSVETELENRVTPPIFNKLSPLVIRSSETDFSLSKLLKSLGNDDLIGKPAIRLEKEEDKLQKNYEIISTSLLRVLKLLDLLDFSNGKISPNKWTKSLILISQLDEEFQEEYLLLLIFFKLNVFGLDEDFSANLVGSIKTTDPEKRRIGQLISRLATFVKVDQKNQNYAGPISRNLLSFRSSIDLLKTNTRELLESTLVSSLSNNEVAKLERSTDEWKGLVSEIPYKKTTPNTILGIVFQIFLDLYFINDDISTSKQITLNLFKIPAASLVNLDENFTKGLKFFKGAFEIAKSLEEESLISKELFETFTKSNALVEKILEL